MSRRKSFFRGLPGPIINLPSHEVRLEVTGNIELPSGAFCERTFQLRLGRVFPSGHKHSMFKAIKADGLTGLPGLKPTKWTALEYLIKEQGLETLISQRKAQIAERYRVHRNWKLALEL